MLMFTRDYAKHPCIHLFHSQGFAVRPIRRYPSKQQLVTYVPFNFLHEEPVMSSGRTHWSNSSLVKYPSSKADSRRVVPFS